MGYRKVGYLEQLWHVIKWKIFHRRKCRGGIIPKRPKPLSGRALDHEAWEQFGIIRKQGETDGDLRARIMDQVENEYIGAAVVPLDDFREYATERARKYTLERIAEAIGIPAEILTGRQEPKNDPKQEGDA